jgi:hypothetical protein
MGLRGIKSSILHFGYITTVTAAASIIIIIIIIIAKDTISSMQGIYTYISKTNHVPKQYNVAAIL